MSKVCNIRSFYKFSISKWPINSKFINRPVCRSKHSLCQNEFRDTRIVSPLQGEILRDSLCIGSTNYLRNSSINNNFTNNVTVRHFTQSNQTLCSAKEKPTTVDESVEDTGASKEELSESKLEKELKEKVESLTKEVSEYKDKYQRSLAERENLRQRLERQIQDSKQFGIQSFCKDLLEVTDVFRKAIESVPQEKVEGADPVFISLYDGVVMTESHLISVFRRHGLQKVTPQEGEKFDPSSQEAMFEVPVTDGKSPGTVAHIIRSGWKLHERCIRSAQVGVIKA